MYTARNARGLGNANDDITVYYFDLWQKSMACMVVPLAFVRQGVGVPHPVFHVRQGFVRLAILLLLAVITDSRLGPPMAISNY